MNRHSPVAAYHNRFCTFRRYCVGAILHLFSVGFAMAEDQLVIDIHSQSLFSGTYYTESHTVTFQSTGVDPAQIYYAIAVDGDLIEAHYNFASQRTELWAGDAALTEEEQELLGDAAIAVAHYIKSGDDEVTNNVLVLLGALEYWPELTP